MRILLDENLDWRLKRDLPGHTVESVSPKTCSLESAVDSDDSFVVQMLEAYSRQAMKLAEVTFLGESEGFVARIPGFRGLLATGATKKEALTELQTALADWIALALKRGLGLPALTSRGELVSSH